MNTFINNIVANNKSEDTNCNGTLTIHKISQVNDKGEPILYMIPVRRKSDGAYGMYDTINKVFYIDDDAKEHPLIEKDNK